MHSNAEQITVNDMQVVNAISVIQPAAPQPEVALAPPVVTRKVNEEEISFDLVANVVGQLQPVIQKTINRVILMSKAGLSNQDLAFEIIIQLAPEILRVIREAVAGDPSYDVAKRQRLQRTIIAGIRPTILQTIQAFRFLFKTFRIKFLNIKMTCVLQKASGKRCRKAGSFKDLCRFQGE
jgi:hypothetical protein